MYRAGLPQPGVLPGWEIFAWVWNLLRFVEEAKQYAASKDRMSYLGDFYNLLDLASYMSIVLAAAIRIYVARDCGWPAEPPEQLLLQPGCGELGLDAGGQAFGLRLACFLYGP